MSKAAWGKLQGMIMQGGGMDVSIDCCWWWAEVGVGLDI